MITVMTERIVSFKDLTCRKSISVNGTGIFFVGLSLDGNLVIERDEETLALVLLQLSVLENGGTMLSPTNRDLTCVVNSSEVLTGETNLIDGMRIEIADKTLVFINGPIPKLRRKLPRTPGQPVVTTKPPAKPVRTPPCTQPPEKSLSSRDADHEDQEKEEQARWLEKSWCMLDLPVVEQEMFTGLDTPEKVGILAGSYFCKQVKLFTDAVISAKRLDDIFCMFLETVEQCTDIFMEYLSDVSTFLEKIPDHSNSQPMHGPAIRLLTRLLTQSLDPVSRVVLILDLLRTFSHFDLNLSIMVRCQTTAAVLGSLAAFLDVVEVQQYAIDILAKIAKYRPKLDKKAPLRDVGIDLVVRGLDHHRKHITLCRSGCRVFANLSSTLLSILNQWLDEESSCDPTIASAVDINEQLLLYVFEKGIPAVQIVLKDFRTDLGISTEGRRFIFYYAKLPQLQMKKTKWLKMRKVPSQTEPVEPEYHTGTESELESSNQESFTESHDPSINQANFLKKDDLPEPEVQGILKDAGCYENNRVSEKRLLFADDTVGGSDSDTDTCMSESDLDLVKSFEESVKIDKDKKEIYTEKVQHVMKKTITRRKSMRGEVVASESDTEDTEGTEDSFADDELGEIKKMSAENDQILIEHKDVKCVKISDKSGFDQDRHEDTEDEPFTVIEMGEITENQNQKLSDSTVLSNNNTAIRIANETSDIDTITDSKDESISCEKNIVETKSKKSELVSSIQKDAKLSDISNETDMLDKGKKSFLNDDIKEKIEKSQIKCVGTLTTNDINGQVIDRKQISRVGTDDVKPRDCAIDTHFFGKLVRTQIIIHVGSLVFQGEDSQVLMVIDQPIKPLLTTAGAQQEVIHFAENQYGADMTLMDLEPAIVINIIDAVRYRSVTKNLVQSSLLGLTRTINTTLQQDTVNTVMLFYKAVFADQHLQSVLTDEEFLKEFRVCFQNATERLEKNHTLDEIRHHVTQKSYAV